MLSRNVLRCIDFLGYQVTTWYGVFAPAGTPPAIVNRLHADLVKAMQTPDVRGEAGRHRRRRHGFALAGGIRRAGARRHRALREDRQGHRPEDRLR